MGLFSRHKNQAAIDEMENDLIETEETSDFTIETPVSNFEEVAQQEEVVEQHAQVEVEQPQAAAPQVQTQSKDSQNWLNEYEGEGALSIDVYQTDESIVIKSTIAGVQPEDLDVSINADMLTIRGTRKRGEVIAEENYFYQECYWGAFARSVILPLEVKADKIEAVLKDGILTVTLPKAQKDKTRKILVKPAK